MEKSRNVQRKKIRKKGGPKLRFKFGVIISIFIFSFAVCFLIYMINANVNENFLEEEFGTSSVTSSDSEETTISDDNKSVEEETKPDTAASGVSNPVPQSATSDSSYYASSCLVTDGTLAGMKGIGFSEDSVFGGEGVNLSAVTTAKQESSFGTLSPYDIVKQKKPSALYLMFGSELETASTEQLVEEYAKLVNSFKSAVPEMNIYVMQYPPVLYDTDTLSNEKVNDYNSRLITMCDNLGVYCIDTNTALKSESGKLNETYWSYETLTLSAEGYNKVSEYILTHVVQ